MRTVAVALIALSLLLGCLAAAGCGRKLSEEEKEFLEDAIYHEVKRDVGGEEPDATEETKEEPEEEEEEAEAEPEETKPKQDIDDYYAYVAGNYVREDYHGDFSSEDETLMDKWLVLKAEGTYSYGLSMLYSTGDYKADPDKGTVALGNLIFKVRDGSDSPYLIDEKGLKWYRTTQEPEVPEFAL